MTTQQNSNGTAVIIKGRLIWTLGQSIFEGQKKLDMNTKQPVIDASGNQVIEYGFGLAVPKMNPQTNQWTEEYVKIYQALNGEALTLFPGGQIPQGFAMKMKDGDGVDHNGKPFSSREGYAGHVVISCTTRIPIQFFKFDGQQNVRINTGIKCGDYVEAQINIKAHPAAGQAKAGLYVNPNAVRFIQEGKEIINAPSGDQIFGTTVPAYDGQVVAPDMGQMPNTQMAPQGQMQMPNTQQAPVQQEQMQMPNTQMAPQQVDPNYNVLPQQYQPPQNQMQMPNTQMQMPNTQTQMPNTQMPAPGQMAPQGQMQANPTMTGQMPAPTPQ